VGGTRKGRDKEVETVKVCFSTLAADFYETGIQKLVTRCDKCLSLVGDR
jgi:hypothetical protein